MFQANKGKRTRANMAKVVDSSSVTRLRQLGKQQQNKPEMELGHCCRDWNDVAATCLGCLEMFAEVIATRRTMDKKGGWRSRLRIPIRRHSASYSHRHRKLWLCTPTSLVPRSCGSGQLLSLTTHHAGQTKCLERRVPPSSSAKPTASGR